MSEWVGVRADSHMITGWHGLVSIRRFSLGLGARGLHVGIARRQGCRGACRADTRPGAAPPSWFLFAITRHMWRSGFVYEMWARRAALCRRPTRKTRSGKLRPRLCCTLCHFALALYYVGILAYVTFSVFNYFYILLILQLYMKHECSLAVPIIGNQFINRYVYCKEIMS